MSGVLYPLFNRCTVCHGPAVVTVYGVPGSELHYCDEHRPEHTRLTAQRPPDAARTQVVADALRLVRRVANRDPLYVCAEDEVCFFCEAERCWTCQRGKAPALEHADGCVWLEAQRLVAQLDGASGHTDRAPDAESATLGRPKGE